MQKYNGQPDNLRKGFDAAKGYLEYTSTLKGKRSFYLTFPVTVGQD